MELVNQRFGKLVVLGKSEQKRNRNILWKCLCDCGNIVYLPGYTLKTGNTKSCGCWNREHNQLDTGQASLNRLYYRYKRGAKSRKIPFTISIDEFYSVVVKQCFYCGDLPEHEVKDGNKQFNGNIHYTGIDRINNEVGYIAGNIVPCCSKCNYAKRDMSYNEFIAWARKLNEGIIERDIRKALGGSTNSMSLSLGKYSVII